MAKKKSTGKKRATRRRTAKKSAPRRRGRVTQAGYGGMLTEIAKGVLGAVVATKVAPMIPVEDARIRYGIVTGAGLLLGVKGGDMRAIGVGMGVAGGVMLTAEFFPNLLGTGTPSSGTVGRLSPALAAKMQASAERIRAGINGNRGRTIMGTGEGGDFPQPVNGYRSRTIVGSGDPDGMSY